MKNITVALILFIVSWCSMNSNANAQCNNNDFSVLKSIYDNININAWSDNTGWSVMAANSTCPSGFDLGTLHGVTLNANDRVMALNLSNNNLIGVLPNDFDGLEELMALNLSENKLSGNIPSSIGDIESLEVLQLQENNLNGTTGFTGSIPITGDNFPSLRILRLNKNSLTGGIPEGIGTTINLEEIGIHNNSLGGTLPPSIGYLPNLTNLKLFNNNLTGCFPTSYHAICQQLTNHNIDNGNSLDATWANFCVNGVGACDRPFIATFNTGNLGINTPCNTCVVIPTTGGGYNYDIDWDLDGNYDEMGLTGDAMHDYGLIGTYQVAIRGAFPRIYFSGTPENNKIVSVDQWGDIRWQSMELAFHTCGNLNILATDAPILTETTNMSGMFSNASSLNADLSNWNVSKITNMFAMFFNATSFDQELSAWVISAVTTMDGMLDHTAVNGNHYDRTLLSWSEQDVQSGVDLGADGLSYCSAEDARTELIQDYGWSITEDERSCSFITTWKTDNTGSSCPSCITIPTQGFGYNYDVDWDNNGVYDSLGVTGDITHDYGAPGTYTIAIRGEFPRIFFSDIIEVKDNEKLITVDQWGDIQWESMFRSFYNCINLTIPASDIPDLALVTNMAYMFGNAIVFNQDISMWDVSTVTTMEGLFSGASLFNQPLNWGDKTSNVEDMSFMFRGATAFNQDVSDWDVSTVTEMHGMFENAQSFNQPLNWGEQTANVTGTFRMFSRATVFNQDLSDWDVSSVTDMSSMFENATSFNGPLNWGNQTTNVQYMFDMFRSASEFDQDISDWDVSSVMDMSSMFFRADAFNSPLTWGNQTANVTDMSEMFRDANAFNQNLSDWDVSSVTDMTSMFEHATSFNSPLDWGNQTGNVVNMIDMFFNATSFNQDLSAWDVSAVTDMTSMFENADAFNQDISGWTVSNVTSMADMFNSADAFNNNISDWDITAVTDMSGMLSNSGMKVLFYDLLLKGWASQSVQLGVFLGADGVLYCEGEADRQQLIEMYNWNITGDDQDSGTIMSSVGGLWGIRDGWSLGRIPSFCNDIILDHGLISEILLMGRGKGGTLEIEEGTSLEVEAGGILEIGAHALPE